VVRFRWTTHLLSLVLDGPTEITRQSFVEGMLDKPTKSNENCENASVRQERDATVHILKSYGFREK
jgi:hypothetical protein